MTTVKEEKSVERNHTWAEHLDRSTETRTRGTNLLE